MKARNVGHALVVGALALSCSGCATTLEHDLGGGDTDEIVIRDGADSVPPPSSGSGGYTSEPGGAGGGATGEPSLFVDPMTGFGESGDWRGYLSARAGDASLIVPEGFTGSYICVNGVVGPAHDEWAAVGWNIAQDIDPLTFEGLGEDVVSPRGAGVKVSVLNYQIGSTLRVMLTTDLGAAESWCAPLPSGGTGELMWSDFRKDCSASGGQAYDPITPIGQIWIQAHSTSDVDPTPFDFCWVDVAPLP